MSEQQLELELGAAPCVTVKDIEDNIDTVYYFTGGDAVGAVLAREGMSQFGYHSTLDLLTFCVIITRCGFKVVGKSACVSPENFNAASGQKYAREDAVRQLWEPMGYALMQRAPIAA